MFHLTHNRSTIGMIHGNSGRFVSYYRVSTQQQGQSGLGLEAQRDAVLRCLHQRAGLLVAEFTEIETGQGSNALERRPQLKAALELCRKRKATLIIAKRPAMSTSSPG